MSSCVLFSGRGRRGRGEYGAAWRDGKPRLAHRLAYEDVFGEIPEGHAVHHTCETPLCVNPDHLVLVAQREHLRLYHSTERCIHGHRKVTLASGKRYCRVCHRERERLRRQARKESLCPV